MRAAPTIALAAFVSAATSAGMFFVLRAYVGPPTRTAQTAAVSTADAAATRPVDGAADIGADAASAQKVAVPKLAGMTVTQARQALATRGLVLGRIKRLLSDSVPADRVITTDPAAGTELKHGAVVALTLSDGAGDLPIPRVVGRRLARARAALEQAGFEVKVTYARDEDRSEGVILRQLPAAGERAPRGSAVTLVINRVD